MIIPEMVKIGGHKYRVVIGKTPGENLGSLNRTNGTITLSDKIIRSEQEETFLHEVLHAINSQIDEVATESISSGIYAFLKDNKMVEEE